MARKVRPPEDTGTWMNTYSDLVTLLLCFFVLMYSMSTIEAEKWEQFASAFHPGQDTNQVVPDPAEDPVDVALPGQEPPEPNDTQDPVDIINSLPDDFNELFEYLKTYVEENNMQSAIEVTEGENIVYIRFNNNIFFYPDKADLRPESFGVLDFLGDCLHSVQEQIFLININGHTASVQYENYPVSAWTLSGERATNIAIYFDDEKDIAPIKLRPIGYGENYPVAPNDSEENRMRNRRVDMVIISSDSSAAQSEALYAEFEGLFDPGSFPQSGGVDDLLIPDVSSDS